jgi:hypothetical protein
MSRHNSKPVNDLQKDNPSYAKNPHVKATFVLSRSLEKE